MRVPPCLSPRQILWHCPCDAGVGGSLVIKCDLDSTAFDVRLGRSVSLDQAARLLNVSRRTVYNRIREGRLRTIRTLGGSQRVLIASLHEFGFRPQAFSASASAVSFAARSMSGRSLTSFSGR